MKVVHASQTDDTNTDLSMWTNSFQRSEYKQAHLPLHQSEELLQIAQQVGHIGVFEWNLKTNVEFWTPELTELFGMEKNQLKHKHDDWTKLICPQDLRQLNAFFDAWIQSERVEESWEYRFIRQDTGEFRWMEARGRLIRDSNGNAARIVGINIDVTERKRLQAELVAYSKRLEETIKERTARLNEAERLATIGATAGMVGHDIRNPLQTVIGQLYLANCEIKSLPSCQAKENLKEICEIMEDQTIYVNKIVSDLQDYARPLKPIFDKVNLRVALRTALANAHVPRIIKVERKIAEDLILKTDYMYIQRILTNLITNAAQAMPMGGKLTVTAHLENAQAIITVEDTGTGVPEEAKSKLFQPLFTTKSKGQGFGLAVVKRLTDALGGRVTFESEKDKGTKFRVTLPQ